MSIHISKMLIKQKFLGKKVMLKVLYTEWVTYGGRQFPTPENQRVHAFLLCASAYRNQIIDESLTYCWFYLNDPSLKNRN